MNSRFYSYPRDGFFTANFSDYFGYVCDEYLDLVNKINDYLIEHEKRKLNGEHVDFIYHSMRSVGSSINQKNMQVLIYSCMAIEGMLNFYGFVRIGSEYKDNIERIGISEKFSILMMILHPEIGEKEYTPIKRKIRGIFDIRNAMVHPKSKELDFSHNGLTLDPNVVMETLTEFRSFFNKLNPLLEIGMRGSCFEGREKIDIEKLEFIFGLK